MNVYKSVWTDNQPDHPALVQIREFIRENGLVLVASEEFADRRMLFRKAVYQVYVKPGVRDFALSTVTAEAEAEEDYNRENLINACVICDHWHDKETPHLVTGPEDCPDCLALHRTA
ncbi:hypothetical protein ACWDXV_30505 [Nocardia nova]